MQHLLVGMECVFHRGAFGFVEEGVISKLVSACDYQNFLKPSSTEPVVKMDGGALEDTGPGPMWFCSSLCCGERGLISVLEEPFCAAAFGPSGVHVLVEHCEH